MFFRKYAESCRAIGFAYWKCFRSDKKFDPGLKVAIHAANQTPKIRQSSKTYFTILSLDLIQIFIGRKRPSGFSCFAKYISLPNRKNKNCKSRQVGHLKGAKNRKRKCANQNKKVTNTENILQTIKLQYATYLNLIAAKEHS